MDKEKLIWKVKLVNRTFVPTITIGTLAGITNIIVTHLSIEPQSTKAWVACGLLGTCLFALVILGACATIDQYNRLGYPFQNTSFELRKAVWYTLYTVGLLINMALLISSIILIFDLTKAHLASLPAHHSNLVGKASLIIAICCLIYACFALLSFSIWIRNFTRLIAPNSLSHRKNKNHTTDKMIKTIAKGAGSLLELLFGWLCFAAGFIVTSLQLSNKININNSFLNEATPTFLFLIGIIALFWSFMGGHPNSDCIKERYPKISPFTYLFQRYFNKRCALESQLSQVIGASSRKATIDSQRTSVSPNITDQISQLSCMHIEEKTSQNHHHNQTPSTKIDHTKVVETPSTKPERQDDQVHKM